MIYEVRQSDQVKLDLVQLAKNEPKVFAKANRFIEELKEHPKTGLGHPEPLKGKPEGRWSRELTKKHRLSIAFTRPRFMWTCFRPTVTTTTSSLADRGHDIIPCTDRGVGDVCVCMVTGRVMGLSAEGLHQQYDEGGAHRGEDCEENDEEPQGRLGEET